MISQPRVLAVDNHVLALAKPAGMPCVPDESGDESLLDWGKAWVGERFQKPGAVFLAVVHRLDRPVSGVVLFGRTSKGAARLSEAFRSQTTEKTYWAVLAQAPAQAAGEIELALKKEGARNRVHVVRPEDPGAKLARTRYRVLETGPLGCLVELTPTTGRSHQLRVSMASLGRPILGDLRYGAPNPLPDRSIALHAVALEVPHPTRPERLVLRCQTPDLAVWKWRTCRDLVEGHPS